jgi:hypothetical protein
MAGRDWRTGTRSVDRRVLGAVVPGRAGRNCPLPKAGETG